MNNNLKQIDTQVYEKCAFEIADFYQEVESKEYDACRFDLSGRSIISRNAKITPKKVGQFVTFWKRKENGPIEPLNTTDQIDFFVVNVRKEKQFGQFVFPKSVLLKKGIISTKAKEGKRAFRVYPVWDIATNKQAESSQKWQLEFFYLINDAIDFDEVRRLYEI